MLLICAVLAGAGLTFGESAGGRSRVARRFQRAVAREFDALCDAGIAYNDAQMGRGRRVKAIVDPDEGRRHLDDVSKRFSDAQRAFGAAVAKYWPYKETASQRQSVGGKAFAAARTFHSDQVRTGEPDKKAMVKRYLEVAAEHRGTIHADHALYQAAAICGSNMMPPDLKLTYKICLRLAEKQSPTNVWVLLGHEGVANLKPLAPDEPGLEGRMVTRHAERMKSLSDFYRATVSRGPEWIGKHVLVPRRDMTPVEFARSVSDYILRERQALYTACTQMTISAKLSTKPLENLAWLKNEYPGDTFVQEQVDVAIEEVKTWPE